MALLMHGIVLATVLCFTQAYLTGQPCRDYRGELALRWTQCDSCSSQECRCVIRNGRAQADCQRVRAVPIALPFGCHIGEKVQNDTHLACCPIECPQNTCDTTFGASYREGERWTECLAGRSCCFNSCECRRDFTGRLSAQCHQACHGIDLQPGCDIAESFQNATHHDCCRIECTEAQCERPFGGKFREGETWEECSGGCCDKVCRCERQGSKLEPNCAERCPFIELGPGCEFLTPFQNETHKDCCRTQCTGPQSGYQGQQQAQLP